MKRTTALLLAVIAAALLLPGRAAAQPERHELGRRLRAFEAAWEEETNAEARQKALAAVERVTPLFFSGKPGEAARALDEARWALLLKRKCTEKDQWAESLMATLDAQLVDASTTEVAVALRQFYDPKVAAPKTPGLFLLLSPWADKKDVWDLSTELKEGLPAKLAFRIKGLPEGDYSVRFTAYADGVFVDHLPLRLSVAKDLKARLGRLRQTVDGWGKDVGTVDQETVKETLGVLEALADKKILEADYPAARLLREAEAAVAVIAAGKTYYGGDRAGQFWLRLPTAKGTTNLRILVPDAAKAGKPLPVVVALHGMGGSENLFFEGYGAGHIVKLCGERGWILVAPRSGGSGTTADLVDALAKIYPVDKAKVLVVGHSMGAAQAVAAAQATPGRFAAVAALGGGGTVAKDKDALKGVPFFVGVGTKDFALKTAQALRDNLKNAGAEVAFREYADVEHLVVVRAALPDVFALFDKVAKGK